MDHVASIMLHNLRQTKVILAVSGYGKLHKVGKIRRQIAQELGRRIKERFPDNTFGREKMLYHNNEIEQFKNARYGVYLLPVGTVGKNELRGLDVPDVDAIVISRMPVDLKAFVHLSGRVGRTEFSTGLAITLVNDAEDLQMQEDFIEKFRPGSHFR